MFDPSMLAGAASAIGGIAGLFSKRKNPGEEANKYLDKIPGMVNPYYQNFINSGNQQLTNLTGEYGNLVNNTGDVYNRLAGGYKESPGYQFKLRQALQAGGNASAAGGMLGTPQHEQQSMGIANDIASQDFNNYLQNQMALYGQGLQGQQGLETQGYNASTGYGDILGNVQGQKAQNAYAGTAGANQNFASSIGNIASGIGQMGQSYSNNSLNDRYMKYLEGGGGRGY
jgi:hypothetical protein